MNCKNCGAILDSTSLFCQHCGQPVNIESNNINNSQNETIKSTYVNPISTNNEQNFQTNQQYNNKSDNNIIVKIIIIVVIAIVFWIIGIFLGKIMFGEKNNKITLSDLETSDLSTNINQNKEKNTKNNNKKNNDTTTSYIVTSNGLKVSFDVVNTLTEVMSVSDEKDRIFEKKDKDKDEDDYFEIWVSENYSTIDEYMENIEKKQDNKDDNNYSDIKLSDVKTKTVNGKKFFLRSVTYKYGDYEYNDLYVAYEIEEDSLYTIEVEEYQLLTDEEFEGLLNINIEK